MQRTAFGDAIYYKDHVSERSNNIFIGIATGNGSIASGIHNCIYSIIYIQITLGVKMHRM